MTRRQAGSCPSGACGSSDLAAPALDVDAGGNAAGAPGKTASPMLDLLADAQMPARLLLVAAVIVGDLVFADMRTQAPMTAPQS